MLKLYLIDNPSFCSCSEAFRKIPNPLWIDLAGLVRQNHSCNGLRDWTPLKLLYWHGARAGRCKEERKKRDSVERGDCICRCPRLFLYQTLRIFNVLMEELPVNLIFRIPSFFSHLQLIWNIANLVEISFWSDMIVIIIVSFLYA